MIAFHVERQRDSSTLSTSKCDQEILQTENPTLESLSKYIDGGGRPDCHGDIPSNMRWDLVLGNQIGSPGKIRKRGI